MALTSDQETLEHQAKVQNMRADTQLKVEQTRWEPWKVVISAFLAGAAIMGATGTILGYLLGRAH